MCDNCMAGYYGRECRRECPGGACAPCGFHGSCHDGVNGSGACTCFSNATVGYWSTYDCSSCEPGRFGLQCLQRCPVHHATGVVCGNGTCRDGYTGDGSCVCRAGYGVSTSLQDAAARGLCVVCAEGYYGPRCSVCPSDTDQPCSGHGTCNDGLDGDGRCTCSVGYGGANCSFACAVAFGRTCGVGACVGNATCVCGTGWATIGRGGACSTCQSGLYGPACSLQCPACAFGTCTSDGTCACQLGYWGALCDKQCPGGAANPCSGNGTCSQSTGVCTCHASIFTGFFTGDACASCDPRYDAPGCRVPCPVYDGKICFGRGTCYNGTCSDCMPLRNETNLIMLRCGSACQSIDEACVNTTCPKGYYGPTCSNTCPATTFTTDGTTGLVVVNTTCGGHGLCDTAHGNCVCAPGYYGTGCFSPCPGSNLGLCSGRGVCRDGKCSCRPGAHGVACASECPGGYTTPCNDHGSCSETGVCTCFNGYYGDACGLACPGGASTPCNFNGVCGPTGTCSCFGTAVDGYYTGTACDACAREFSGPRCNVSCLSHRGTVVDRACVCLPGYAGSGCAVACPRGGSEDAVCSNHGTCEASPGSPNVATCTCEPDFYGATCSAYCTVTGCLQGTNLYRAQCNPTTGVCECRNAALGHWTGARCDVCQTGFWGDECSIPCACNDHGHCHRSTATCHCFDDDVLGHWAGAECSKCAAGYTGVLCTTINVDLAPAGDAVLVVKATPSTPVALVSVVDLVRGVLLIQLSTSPTAMLIMRPSATGNLSIEGNLTLPGVPVRGTIFNTSHIRFNVGNASTPTARPRAVFVSRTTFAVTDSIAATTVPAGASPQTAMRAFSQLAITTASDDDVPVTDVSVFGILACTLYMPLHDPSVNCMYVLCTDSAPAAALYPITGSSGLFLAGSTPWASTSDDGTVLWVVGQAANDAGNWALVAWHAVDTTTLQIHSNTVVGARGGPLGCAAYSNARVVCFVYDRVADGGSGGLRLLRFDLGSDAFVAVASVGTIVNPTTTIALTVLVASSGVDMGVLAFHQSIAGGSSIYLFQASSMSLVGTIAADAGTILTAAELDTDLRLLFLVLESALSTSYNSLNLFGIKSVWPSVVDANGGATITVRGIAFPVNATGTPMWCNVSDAVLPATVINDTMLTCPTTVALTKGACSVDALTVLVGGAFSGRSTRSGVLGLYRPVPAELVRAETVQGYRGYGPYDRATTVVLIGFGFVSASGARCRLEYLERAAGRSVYVVYETPQVQFLNSSAVVCHQPAGLSSSTARTGFAYSHDGFYYGSTLAPYVIVGATAAMNFDVEGTVVVAASLSTLPAILLYTADAYGNRRLALEEEAFSVRCSSLEPVVQIAGNPEVLNFPDPHALNRIMDQGTVAYDNVIVAAPVAGDMIIYCFAVFDLNMNATIGFTVVAGSPSAIALQSQAAWLAGVIEPRRLQPGPKVWLVDSAGNFVAGSEAYARIIFSAATAAGVTGKEVALATTTQFAKANAEGIYAFENVNLRTAFSEPATMVFSIGDVPSLTFVVPEETCVAGVEYAVAGTFECRPCPLHGICDGTTSIAVDVGYWRSNVYSLEFYQCPAEEAACPGGTSCHPGYRGTRCGQCEDGYGRTGKVCDRCYSPVVNWTLIMFIFAALIGIVFYLSIYTMPVTCNTDAELFALQRTERNPFAIVMKIAISHFQMISMIPFGTLTVPSWMTGFVSGSGAAKMEPNFSFVACALASDDAVMLKLILMLVPVCIGIFLIVSYAAAWYITTFTSKNPSLEKAKLYRKQAAPGVVTATVERRRVAEIVANDDDGHFDAIVKAHDDLLVEGRRGFLEDALAAHTCPLNDCDVTDPRQHGAAENGCDAPTTTADATSKGQRDVDLRERFVNMTALTLVVVLFMLYPTIVDACAGLLQCQSIDYGPHKPPGSVVERDPSIDCGSSAYKEASIVAWAALIGFGVGAPVFSIVVVQWIAKMTCHGNMESAKTIFFFTTGGYREGVWFWESVSLARKFILVLAVTVIQEPSARVLLATWALLLAVMLNIVMHPWAERILSVAEVASLGAVALTFGLCQLLYSPTVVASDLWVTVVYASMALVNLVALGAVGAAMLWSARKTLQLLSSSPGVLGQVCGAISTQVDGNHHISAKDVDAAIAHEQRKLLIAHPRSAAMASVEHSAMRGLLTARKALAADDDPNATPPPLGNASSSLSAREQQRLPPMKSFSHVLGAAASFASHRIGGSGGTRASLHRSSVSCGMVGVSTNVASVLSLDPAEVEQGILDIGDDHVEPTAQSPAACAARPSFVRASSHIKIQNPLVAQSSRSADASALDTVDVLLKSKESRRTSHKWIDVESETSSMQHGEADDAPSMFPSVVKTGLEAAIEHVEASLATFQTLQGYAAMRLRSASSGIGANELERDAYSTLLEELYVAELTLVDAVSKLQHCLMDNRRKTSVVLL